MEFHSGAVSPMRAIEKGWELIKDQYWTVFLMCLIAMAIGFVAAIVVGSIEQGIVLGLLFATSGPKGFDPEAMQAGMPLAIQAVSLVLNLFSNLIILTLVGMLTCGIYSGIDRLAREGSVDIGAVFSGFSKFFPCLIFAVFMAIVQFVFGIVILGAGVALGLGTGGLGGMFKSGRLGSVEIGGLIILFIVIAIAIWVLNIVISILTSFVYPLVSIRGLSGGDAIVTSAKAGLGNFGGILVLAILMGLMFLVGALACLVGMLFVVPVYVAAFYTAFCEVFGIEPEGRSDQPPPPPNFNPPHGYQPGY